MVSIYRYSTKTDVVLGGTVKHPVDVSYDEFFTTSSADIACIEIPIKEKTLNTKQHFPTEINIQMKEKNSMEPKTYGQHPSHICHCLCKLNAVFSITSKTATLNLSQLIHRERERRKLNALLKVLFREFQWKLGQQCSVPKEFRKITTCIGCSWKVLARNTGLGKDTSDGLALKITTMKE